jgi:hypothetical protein
MLLPNPLRLTMKRVNSIAALLIALLHSQLAYGASSVLPSLPPLPALSDPATGVHLRGKFVWADLFTNDVDAAHTFYGELFGWEWRWISNDAEHSYGVFYQGGVAVAGVAHRAPSEGAPQYGRWINYVSVADVARAVSEVEARGGRVLLPLRTIADRGTFAILADSEGALFGILDSSSGDPPDYRAGIGDWLWVQLFSGDSTVAAKLYADLFGYQMSAPERTQQVVDYVLSAQGFARAGIGQLPENSASRPTWLGYVRVADVAQTVAKAISLGGAVLLPPDPNTLDGNLAIVADPHGAIFGVVRWTYASDDEHPIHGDEVQP